MSFNAAARRTLERHDAEDLIPMLGLVAEDGSVPPDDTNVYNFHTDSRGPGPTNPDSASAMPRRPRDLSLVPPGLRHLQPVPEDAPKRRGPAPQPKVIRTSRQREVPECGTYRAYARHKRRIQLGQDDPSTLDDACVEAGRKYHRDYARNYRKATA